MYLKSFHKKFLLLGKPLPSSVHPYFFQMHLSQGPSDSADHNLLSCEIEKKNHVCICMYLCYSAISGFLLIIHRNCRRFVSVTSFEVQKETYTQ